MTKIITYVCDNCDKELPRSAIVEYGPRHYCKECARTWIVNSLREMPDQFSKLTFDGEEGMADLQNILGDVRSVFVTIAERECWESKKAVRE